MELTKQQREQVEHLLAQMTLEEKIGQMNLEAPSIVGGFDVSFEELIEMVNSSKDTSNPPTMEGADLTYPSRS